PGTFIQVAPLVPFQRVVSEGDSGGPVYQNHSAVGLVYAALGHKSKVHPKHGWMLFMPINRLAELVLGVITDSFDIDSVPNVSGPQNADIPSTVDFRGYPRFPVIRRTEVVECDPSGNWNCSDYNATYTDTQATPLTFTFRCNSGSGLPTATFRW